MQIVTKRLVNSGADELAGLGVATLPLWDGWVRLVVHRDHGPEAVPLVAESLSAVLGACRVR